ncbi:MAG: TIGR03118 family protein [Chloroflexota bacterium]
MPRRALALIAATGLLLGIALPAAARNINAENRYEIHFNWSNVPGLAANTDASLVNGWGISHSGTSPWWVSNEGTDTSTLYNMSSGSGTKVPLTVTVEGGPTGQVFNGSANDFKVDAGTGLSAARFIFATENGTIKGWNGTGTTAIQGAMTPDAIYLGLAIGSSGGANYLYAANFHAGTVDVFNGTWGDGSGSLAGDFTDPNLPAGYAPFGIQAIGDEIYVAYAKQDEDAEEEVAGAGLGYVDAFGMDGTFHARVASRGDLNAPWGIARAPAGFGKFSGDLLVGNFGDGRIHAFKSTADGWEPHGVIKGTDHRPIAIDGLWGIGFGNDAAAGPSTTLFFAAGPEDETEGLFGSITAP